MSGNWHISYYNDSVWEQIFELPDGMLARYLKIIEVMQENGPNIGMPHTKALGKGLFELRLKGKEGIARVFYCVVINKEIVMLHSFIKKTQQIPDKELKIAKERMKNKLN